MKSLLLSLFMVFFFGLISIAQNESPVAVNDSVSTLNQIPVSLNVLANDYDPEGDAFEIRNLTNPNEGESSYDDSIATYKSHFYVGEDMMRYKIREIENSGNVSEYAYVFIEVMENPDVPTAVTDSFDVIALVPTSLDILQNDEDINGDELLLYDFGGVNDGDVGFNEDSSMAVFTSDYQIDFETGYFRYQCFENLTEEQYISNEAFVLINIHPNPDVPQAIDDTAETIGGIEVEIPVLENDTDPLDDAIEIWDLAAVDNGIATIEDNKIKFQPDVSYTGETTFKYRIRKKDTPYLYSNWANITVTVEKNPNCPVGVPDETEGMTYAEIQIDVLENDYDSNGDTFEIKDIITDNSMNQVWLSNSQIHFVSSPLSVGSETIFYRIVEVDDTLSYSEWTEVTINLEPNPILPIAEDDLAEVKSGWTVNIPVLANDIAENIEDFEIFLFGSIGHLGRVTSTDTSLIYEAYANISGVDTLIYHIRNKNDHWIMAEGFVYITIQDMHTYDLLDINNVTAGVLSHGTLFSHMEEIIDDEMYNIKASFEYPKGRGKHTIFTNQMWIGGLDENDSLHLAGERYRQNGNDYNTGPIANNYDSSYRMKYERLWKLDKDQINFHRNNYWKEAYQPIADIATWPGSGNASNGEAGLLAPFSDLDNDGIYEPQQGDYPLIRGDQSVFFICNDDRIHTESWGGRLGVEIHGMVYGFNTPEDSILNNTVFVHLDLINRSDNTFHNTLFGLFTDLDLGYYQDDYLGCNVERSTYYVYNANETDGSGEEEAYGQNPPVQSVTVLSGPLLDEDNIDNPGGECNYGVSGINFGNGIVDDERIGLSRFLSILNGSNNIGDPDFAPEYYLLLNGFWKDSAEVSYGGIGYPGFGAAGPACRFMYPGDSDPLNWGTDCVFPNDGYNQDGKFWSEHELVNSPSDRRGVGVIGPFTFKPGDTQEIELAYLVTAGVGDPLETVNQMFENIDTLRQRIKDGGIIVPNNELAVDLVNTAPSNLILFPNPTEKTLTFELSELHPGVIEYEVFDLFGNSQMKFRKDNSKSHTIDVNHLKAGMYIIQVRANGKIYSGKIIKH